MTVTIPASLGIKLKQLRKQWALSGEEVCKKIHINRTTLYLWENDLQVPHPKNLRKLAELYKIPITDLTKED